MAQISRLKTDRRARGTMLRLVDGVVAMPAVDASTANDRMAAAPPARAALELVKVGSIIAGFWLRHGIDQLTRTSQMLQRAAAAGSWQERLELHNAFLRDGFARLNEGMSRYADEVHGIVNRSRDVRGDGSTAPR